MSSREMAKLVYSALSDREGEDIKIIDIQSVFVPANYFIITHGSSPDQVQAITDNVEGVLGREGCGYKQIEGYQNANWILMDCKDMIVHIFCREDRLFYGLERIWRGGKTFVDIDEL